MSRSNPPERWRETATPLRHCLAAWRLTVLALCVSAAACGGSQRSIAPDDGGAADGTAEAVLGPLDPDPCTAASAFDFQPIATFESIELGLASTAAAYVSYDGTGTLFMCDSPGEFCSEATEHPYLTDPFLCGNCVDHGDASASVDAVSCVGCSCMSGNNGGQEKLPITRCGVDAYGMHLRANAGGDTGLTKWGMNVGFDFRENPVCAGQTDPNAGSAANPCFFDATGWTGVSFWAYAGPGTSGAAVALATVADLDTAGQLGSVNPDNALICGDPPCVADVGTGGGGSGHPQCDPFGKAILLVDHWEFYAIPFSEMRQKGYGLPESALEVAHLLGFKFNLGKGAWDVWLADIAFYRPKGP